MSGLDLGRQHDAVEDSPECLDSGNRRNHLERLAEVTASRASGARVEIVPHDLKERMRTRRWRSTSDELIPICCAASARLPRQLGLISANN